MASPTPINQAKKTTKTQSESRGDASWWAYTLATAFACLALLIGR